MPYAFNPFTGQLDYFQSTTGIAHSSLTGLLNDDHTQYALLAGRAGGQTLKGGTNASDNLLLQSTNNATRGFVQIEDLSQIGTSAHAWGSSTGYYIALATGNCNITTGSFGGIGFTPTITVKGNSTLTLTALFNSQATITDDGTARTPGPALIFASENTYTATVASGLTCNDLAGIPNHVGLYFTLTLGVTGGGTATMATACGVYISAQTKVQTGWTLTNYIGMLIDYPNTVTGTLTNFYGIKNNGAAGTNRWFLFEGGGMQSSHKGNLRIGDNTAPTAVLDVKGTINSDQTTANGSVATTLGSLGPTGSNTTVQGWFTIKINGTTRYIPYF